MIRIQQVTKAFDEKPLLVSLNIDIKDGARLGIIGENGCGKTTLMNILASQIECDSGSVYMPNNTVIAYMEQVQFSKEDETLSGGERTKKALKTIFSEYSNVLILDEPTNHLDYKGILWLKTLIDRYTGTVIMVSHDRYFMDLICQEIYEIQNTKGTLYTGNYSDYKAEKEHRYLTQKNAYDKDRKAQSMIQADIAQLSTWSQKAHRESTIKGQKTGNKMGAKEYFRAKAKKSDKAVKSKLKRLEKLVDEGLKKPEEDEQIKFQFYKGDNNTKQLIYCEDVEISFGQNLLFETSRFSIMRGERLAFIGQNGSGKTTFIRMLRKEILAYKGRLSMNPSVRIGYLSQDVMDLDPRKSIIDSLGYVEKDRLTLARIQLNNLGIDKDMIHRKISTLSMGERTRVKLASILLEPFDILILDEPTNHLDIISKEVLEKALLTFEGTILIVSHDLYLLNALCTSMLLIENKNLMKVDIPPKEWLAASLGGGQS